jgi:hypothetical protein
VVKNEWSYISAPHIFLYFLDRKNFLEELYETGKYLVQAKCSVFNITGNGTYGFKWLIMLPY